MHQRSSFSLNIPSLEKHTPRFRVCSSCVLDADHLHLADTLIQSDFQEQFVFQYLTQGHWDMQTGGAAEDLTPGHLITVRPAVPPEHQEWACHPCTATQDQLLTRSSLTTPQATLTKSTKTTPTKYKKYLSTSVKFVYSHCDCCSVLYYFKRGLWLPVNSPKLDFITEIFKLVRGKGVKWK